MPVKQSLCAIPSLQLLATTNLLSVPLDLLILDVFSQFSCIFLILYHLAGNESCPQPQTSEHLAAIEIMKLKHILILQNKIDLVKESQAKEQYEQILAFVQGKKT